MRTFGKFVVGALAGAATLGVIAGIYCTYFMKEDSDAESFSELESNTADEQIDIHESELVTA